MTTGPWPPPVGLNWPMPGAELVYPSPEWVRTFAEAGFSWVRMNVPVSRDRANAEASVRTMRDNGLAVVPILEWPWAEPDVEALCGFARWYVETFPDTRWITLGNEPWILDKVPAAEYLRVAEPLAATLERASPTVRVVFALDLYDYVSGASRRWPGVNDVVAAIAAGPRRYADLHPYRNPFSPFSSPWGTRADEYAALITRLGHDRFIYGEVGWGPAEGRVQASGVYHVAELALDTAFGVPLVAVYTHTADLDNPAFDFGLWIADPTTNAIAPRRAARTLAAFLTYESD